MLALTAVVGSERLAIAEVRKGKMEKSLPRLGLSADGAVRERGRESASLRIRHGLFDVRWTPLSAVAAEPAQWHDLIRRAIEPNVFLEPAFARAAARHLGGDDVGVIAVYAADRLVALLPGRVEGMAAGRPLPIFVAWIHPFAPLSAPLLDRDLAAEAVAAILETLPHLPGAPKAALFPLLPENSAAARLIGLHAAARNRSISRFGTHARAVLIPDRGEALSMISTRKRKKLRRQRRRLSELGTVEYSTARGTSDLHEALADFMAVEVRNWKGRAGGAAACNPHTSAFMSEAVTALGAEGKVRIDRLTLDGVAIAATIALYSGDYAWFWKVGYDEAFARFSPGVQISITLTDAFEADRELSLVDSCAVADHPMIDHLWGGRLAMADWLVPLDGPYSFAATVAAERVRRIIAIPLRSMKGRLRRRFRSGPVA